MPHSLLQVEVPIRTKEDGMDLRVLLKIDDQRVRKKSPNPIRLRPGTHEFLFDESSLVSSKAPEIGILGMVVAMLGGDVSSPTEKPDRDSGVYDPNRNKWRKVARSYYLPAHSVYRLTATGFKPVAE